MTGREVMIPGRRRGAAWRVLFRFAVGMPLDGKRRTDATFLRRGTQALVPRWFGLGGASGWAMMPGWQRAAIRWLTVAAVTGMFRWRHATEWALALTGGPSLGVLAWLSWQRLCRMRHHAATVRPLAAALAPSLETTPEEVERALAVPRDHGHPDAEVTAALPAHWQGHPAQLDAITRIASQRLGGEWTARVQRSPLLLVASHPPAPPGVVAFREVAELIRAQGSATRILMGLGTGDEPVWQDVAQGPHVGLSVGPGGGKSTFLRFLLAQLAYHGIDRFPCLDAKGISLAGMESLKGLVIYRDDQEQWDALAGLRKEMQARYAEMLAHPGTTFPPVVVIGDEMNDAAISWRAHWQDTRPQRSPATPPVYDDWTRLLIKGRECGFRFWGAWQRLSVASCGGMNAGLLRDALAVKALAFAGPGAWDSLTGLRPRQLPPLIPGRWAVVMGQEVRQVQVPNADAAELLDFVASAPARPDVPVSPVGVITPGQDGERDRDIAPREAVVIGLAAAAERLRMTPEGLRKARQRAPIPGEFRAADGRPGWPLAALTAWAQSRPVAGQRYPSPASEGVAAAI